MFWRVRDVSDRTDHEDEEKRYLRRVAEPSTSGFVGFGGSLDQGVAVSARGHANTVAEVGVRLSGQGVVEGIHIARVYHGRCEAESLSTCAQQYNPDFGLNHFLRQERSFRSGEDLLVAEPGADARGW